MEVDFEINDITPRTVDARLRRYSNYDDIEDDPWYAEVQRHQEALLKAVTSNPKVLDWLLTKYLIDDLRPGMFHEASRLNADERDVLDPLIMLLPEDTQEYYREADERGLRGEYNEDFHAAINIKLTGANIIDVGQ